MGAGATVAMEDAAQTVAVKGAAKVEPCASGHPGLQGGARNTAGSHRIRRPFLNVPMVSTEVGGEGQKMAAQEHARHKSRAPKQWIHEIAEVAWV